MVSSVALSVIPKPKNFNEMAMQQTLIFSDGLKDLKNLKAQLYTAAEYFETSTDDQKRLVVESLKEYGIKALVNTVDHLGSITYKVNDLLGEKIDQASATELRLSCLEQRLRTCQKYVNRVGLSQQSVRLDAPKYHKRYILPVGATMVNADDSKRFQGHFLDDDDDWHHLRTAVRATISESPSPALRKEQSPSPSPSLRPLQRAQTFMFSGGTPNRQDKGTTSPHRFPLLRFGTFSSRPTTPNSRATTPNSLGSPTTSNSCVGSRRYASEPRQAVMMHMNGDKKNEKYKDLERYPSKSKRLFKALLSRRKSKKDDVLYTYLDEY